MMRKLFWFGAIAIFSLAILTSCKKDKDGDDSGDPGFSYDGNDYDLTKGMLIPYGQTEDGTYEFEVWLYGGSLIIFNPDSATGTGSAIGFTMFCNPAALANGTYHIADTCCAPMTIWGAGFFIDWNSDMEDYPDYVWFDSGAVEAGISGSTYEFHFDFVTEAGKSVKGYYKGSLWTFTP